MSAATISPVGNIAPKNIIEVSPSAPTLKGVAIGEVLPATVLEKTAENNYNLALKNQHIPATSTLVLNAGEKLTVKVSSIEPQIILNIIENKNQTGDVKIQEKLRQWRTNPESLLQVLNKAGELTKLLQTNDLPSKIVKSDIEKLLKLFSNIIFSSRTMNNHLFIKDFIYKTGLLLESSLRQFIDGTYKGEKEKLLENNIKSLLLKLSSAIQEIVMEKSKYDINIVLKLLDISAFVDKAIQVMEIKQALNAVFQDSDNGLILQIPLALGDGFSLADIFITPEHKNKQGKTKFSSCTVRVFLDLDMLGSIAVNAGIREGTLNCLIKCESEEIKKMINGNLTGLKKALSSAGYRVDYIDCIQAEKLNDERKQFLARQSFSVTELVNFFA